MSLCTISVDPEADTVDEGGSVTVTVTLDPAVDSDSAENVVIPLTVGADECRHRYGGN